MNECLRAVPQCPICLLDTLIQPAYRLGDYQIWRCRQCELMLVHPQPSTVTLQQLYSESYFERGSKYRKSPETNSENTSVNDARKVNQLSKYCSAGNLLDIGCALGGFLASAREKGFTCAGVEFSDFAADYTRRLLGIPVHTGPLSEAKLPLAAFDAVTLWDVIEHLVDPVGDVRTIRALLKPDGIIAISTGDYRSVTARMLGRFWPLLTPPQHLFYFSERSLGKLLQQNGFDILSIHKFGRWVTIGLAVLKIEESLGLVSHPFTRLIKRTGLGSLKIYYNSFDTMTVFARLNPQVAESNG